jgi:hypothetical protein
VEKERKRRLEEQTLVSRVLGQCKQTMYANLDKEEAIKNIHQEMKNIHAILERIEAEQQSERTDEEEQEEQKEQKELQQQAVKGELQAEPKKIISNV